MTNKRLVTLAFNKGFEAAINIGRYGTDMVESDIEKFAAEKLQRTLEELEVKDE